MRILGNLAILVWLTLVQMKNESGKRWISYTALGIYLAFNSWSIVGDDVFLSFTGQGLSVMFALILSTVLLSAMYLRREGIQFSV